MQFSYQCIQAYICIANLLLFLDLVWFFSMNAFFNILYILFYVDLMRDLIREWDHLFFQQSNFWKKIKRCGGMIHICTYISCPFKNGTSLTPNHLLLFVYACELRGLDILWSCLLCSSGQDTVACCCLFVSLCSYRPVAWLII